MPRASDSPTYRASDSASVLTWASDPAEAFEDRASVDWISPEWHPRPNQLFGHDDVFDVIDIYGVDGEQQPR